MSGCGDSGERKVKGGKGKKDEGRLRRRFLQGGSELLLEFSDGFLAMKDETEEVCVTVLEGVEGRQVDFLGCGV